MFCLFLFAALQLHGQAPQSFNYQAVCRDNLGNIITGQPISLRLTLHDLLPAGAVLYKETHNVTTNNFGLVTISVGGGTVDTGNFMSINWAAGDKYLEVELDAGSGFNSIGTTQLLSVPYALYASSSGDTTMWKKNGNDIYRGTGNVGIGTVNPMGALDVTSTTGAFMPPRMTTSQRDALTPLEGMIIYNTSVSKFQGYQMNSGTILQIDTGSNNGINSIVNGFWILYQSFTAPTSMNISSVEIVTDAITNENGTLEILAGDGVGGAVLYTQSIIYAGCGTGKCGTQITLTTPFAISSGVSYTLKFSATTGGLSAVINYDNPYPGGMIYQNSTSHPTNDMYLKLYGAGLTWSNFE